MPTFHLLPNAHLDPVWLWDWREGLNQGLTLARTVLDLMDEFPDLTFIRGESAVYQHIQQFDPATFARIKQMVKKGRWDIVGGTLIQPDTNLPATETFLRQFDHGKKYFRKTFGKDVTVAWTADSFGHSAGMPEIFAASGIRNWAFTRPAPNIIPLERPAFWWQGPGDSRILSYQIPHGWYGCERDELPKRLDGFLSIVEKAGLDNLAIFFGLGDHGGGPTRRHILDIAAWAKAHPEVKIVYSTMHRFFDALNKEIARKGEKYIPTHRGELNFVLRGCYSSVAKFKFAYRRAENRLIRAEKTHAAISSAIEIPPANLHDPWRGLLFNSFHDILPGSSIERAFDEQLDWLGGVTHQARKTEAEALNHLMMQIDTSVPEAEGDMPRSVPLVIFNPHPRPYRGLVEVEAALDDRPIWQYSTAEKVNQLPVSIRGSNGKPLPVQFIDTEHSSLPTIAWRKRVLVPLDIPAMGWNVITMGWDESRTKAKVPLPGARAAENRVANSSCEIKVDRNKNAINITIGKTKTKLSAITVEDPWGSWGGMAEEPESLDLSTVRHHWKITDVVMREVGSLRAALWVKLEAGKSRLELTISLSADRQAVDVSARVLWNERSARLKLVMTTNSNEAEFEVPGGTVTREPLGEVPGGKWVRCGDIAFISDSLYNFDVKDRSLRATVVRASRYANDVPTKPEGQPWIPAVDAGELKFKFILAGRDADLNQLSEDLEQPPIVVTAPAKEGKLPRAGSLLKLEPKNLKLLSLRPSDDRKSLILRAQEIAGRSVTAKITIGRKALTLGKVPPNQIRQFRFPI